MRRKFKIIFDAILNSYSKVFFAENKILGFILLLVSFLDYWSGLMGIVSILTVIILVKILKFDTELMKNGAYGYNSLLVGLGIGLYFEPSFYIFFLTIIFSAISFFLTVNIKGFLTKYGLPYLSIPFLITMWIVSLSIFTIDSLGISERWIYVYNDLYAIGGDFATKIYEKLSALDIPFFWRTYFLSLGAIFFQMSTLAGIIIAIGLLIYSRIVFLLSLVGFSIAFFSFELLHIDMSQLSYTYIGFNFILTAIAVGGYYVMPGKSSFLSLLFLMPVSVFISISGIKIFSNFNLPLYSLPFNIVVLMYLYALRLRYDYTSAGLIEPIYPKSTPEYTLYDFQNNLDRFYSLNYLPVFLPVNGFWYVSQGHNGTYTHKGDWKYAWDFVITDEKGNQFSGTGDFLEDYYCYGKNVFAPADGTVVKVINSVPDNQISKVNIKENWGNVIVIKHSEYLYSLLAHLKIGSIKVKEGQFVKRGQLLAQVGNSGRSPYPHLHFQFQSSPYVGSPTLEYPLAYYILKNQKNYGLKKYTIPKEGQTIANVITNDIMTKVLDLPPGKRLNVSFKNLNTNEQKNYLWQINTTANNIPYIYCPETDSYAFFKNDGTAFFMTDFKGSKKSPLFYFYLSAYKILLAYYKNLEISDPVPIYHIFSNKFIMFLQDFIAPFYLFIKGEFRLKYENQNIDFTDEFIETQSVVLMKYFQKKSLFLKAETKFYENKIIIDLTIKKHSYRLEIS